MNQTFLVSFEFLIRKICVWFNVFIVMLFFRFRFLPWRLLTKKQQTLLIGYIAIRAILDGNDNAPKI